MTNRPAGFGTWHFTDELIPKVEEFSAMFRQHDYGMDNFNPWGILFGHNDMPQLAQQQLYAMEWSDDRSDDELEQNVDHHKNPVADRQPISKPQQQITMTIPTNNNEQGPLAVNELSPLHQSSQVDESMPQSQETFVQFQGCVEGDGIAEQVELLESGASEMDLTALPTAVVIEVFRELTDRGLCHATEAVCAMKPTDQARFNSITITHLLLPRLQVSNVRCTQQVMSAFSQFISCCPVLSCQQLLAPLIVATPPQHMDTIKYLLKQIKHQPQKDLILKALLETLPSMNDPHLALFLLLIGPTENDQLKKQLIQILSNSADKFPHELQFGKLLLRVIPLVSTLPDLKEQLTNIVNRHESVVKSSALKLLSK